MFTINYDVAVILPIESYLIAYKKIIRQEYDLVYPFSIGKYQKKVNESGRKKLLDKASITELTPHDYSDCQCEYGHCQFVNTQSYKSYGWENEHFVSSPHHTFLLLLRNNLFHLRSIKITIQNFRYF